MGVGSKAAGGTRVAAAAVERSVAARRDGPGGEGREILSASECAGARGPACTARKSLLASTPRKLRRTSHSTVRSRREGEEEDGEDRRLLERLRERELRSGEGERLGEPSVADGGELALVRWLRRRYSRSIRADLRPLLGRPCADASARRRAAERRESSRRVPIGGGAVGDDMAG